jgi:hypothetical protein
MIAVKVQVRSITLEVKHTLLEFIWYGESSTYVCMQYELLMYDTDDAAHSYTDLAWVGVVDAPITAVSSY